MRPFSQRTVSCPRLVQTLTSFEVRPLSIEATAAAQEPVPEDRVSPTPRSQNRTSISCLLMTRMNSTFVLLGKRVAFDLVADLAPDDAGREEALDE